MSAACAVAWPGLRTAAMPPAVEDGELARRILGAPPGGSRADEAELCSRFAPRVRLYGLRHLRDEHAAADLAQRVLVLTIEKLRAGAVREPDRIASFVLGTARMIARNMARDGRREEPVAEPPDGAEEAGGAEPLALDRLGRCLEGLTHRERAVVLMTFYEERRAAEIAAAIASSEANVRVIRHRAIARLRSCVEQGEDA